MGSTLHLSRLLPPAACGSPRPPRCPAALVMCSLGHSFFIIFEPRTDPHLFYNPPRVKLQKTSCFEFQSYREIAKMYKDFPCTFPSVNILPNLCPLSLCLTVCVRMRAYAYTRKCARGLETLSCRHEAPLRLNTSVCVSKQGYLARS